MQGEALRPALRSAGAALSRHRDLLDLQLGALDGRSLGYELEAEGEGGGDVLAQVADPATLLRDPVDDFVADFAGRDRGYRGLGFRPAPSLTQCPAVLTIRLLALFTSVPEHT